MSNWLLAKYSLHLKKLYDDVKDRIPGRLQGSFIQNRKVILNYVLPLVRSAYREGIDFGIEYLRSRFNKKVKVSYQINQKMKETLFREFILLIRNAEDIYKLKMDQRERLLKVEKRKNGKSGSDKDQIIIEYENAVKRAVNNLILNSGELGLRTVDET